MITRRDFLKVTGVAAAAAALTACGGSSSTASSAAASGSVASSAAAKLDKIKVAVPNDTTNEARALTLLEKNGFFKLKADAGLTATKNDIEENPLNVTVDEVEAAQVPNVLQDEDYAVINSNYAISAGLNPMTDALAMEDGSSAYVNVLVCKDGNRGGAQDQGSGCCPAEPEGEGLHGRDLQGLRGVRCGEPHRRLRFHCGL